MSNYELYVNKQLGLDTLDIDPLCCTAMSIVLGTLDRHNFPGHRAGDRSVATQLEMIEMQL